MAAAALAKALRGWRSSSAPLLYPAIGWRVPQGMLPHRAGPSPANPARHLHTPNESEFAILRLHERLNTIESYKWWILLAPLVAGGVMVSPMVMDYIHLKKIEWQIRALKAEIEEAKLESERIEKALHGV